MAFGYALLSVCLFRILAFTLSSTAFFLLYVAVSMPLGACLAQRKVASGLDGLPSSIRALSVMTLLLPVLGLLSTRGPALITEPNLFAEVGLELGVFWRLLGYQLAVVCPLFIAWGFAEFIGYRMAMGSDSSRLRQSFYLIFVWALACAVAVGFLTIPRWGWLRTLVLAAVAAMVARDFSTWTTTKRLGRIVPYLIASLSWVAAGALERVYVRQLFVDHPFNVGALLHDRSLPWGDRAPGGTWVLEARWGKYTHFTLVQSRRGGGTTVVGAYDGTIHWTVNPGRDPDPRPDLQRVVFDLVPEKADVAILGAGGGRQVTYALGRNPKHVVAVDLIPEVFTLLEGEYAWANGHVYQSPLVETVAADGRNYLQTSSRRFDLILLPNTESWGAAVRAFFEPGGRIHTVEAFQMMRSRLKSNGLLVIIKTMDRDARLFNDYAISLRQAGYNVIGWIHRTRGFPGQPIVLVAGGGAIDPGERAREFFTDQGFEFVDFQETPPNGEPIYDDSPWARGVLEMWIPRDVLQRMLHWIGAIAAAGVAVALGLSLRRLNPGETVAKRLLFVLAGMSIGVHAVYLQNGIIYWLLFNLMNPLAAFFLGTSLFLLAWGLSSTMLKRRGWILLLGGSGFLGLLLCGSWHGYATALSMLGIALGSGLFFPMLGLTFQSRFLNLFVADAIGGFVGGLLGIWLPMLFGFQDYFDLMPWTSLTTFILVGLTFVFRANESLGAA
jgi:hypothetical protein